ncbi:hypothetical protein SAMN06893096_109116 [Geodermatophilus pulveris]|uniref:Uncharacterized protein n=1 Tax=Geodermatophilus pulveris TaxID=1564159 RepID=A0A239I0B4_9ACTN|nr:hypothetical protein SAMN06893096_109116 [Geodermatophilus pulveris]
MSGQRARADHRPMTGEPLSCGLGLHAYVRQHPADERPHGPDQEVCRRG